MVLLGLWLARNLILINSFERITDDKSNHHVHLSISSLNFSVSNMTLTTDSITIAFDSTYLDKSHNASLSKLKFSGVLLQNFDIWTLLFDKQLMADKLVFLKPDVFISTNKTGKTSEINPEDVIRIFSNDFAYHFAFPAKLKKVEIRYGQIDVTDRNNPSIKFSANNLTLFMEDFNSILSGSKATGLKSLSKTLYLKAENLYKSFKSNYAFSVDSLWWTSNRNKFNAYGFRLQPTAKIADTAGMITIEAGRLTANEFHLLGDTIQSASVDKLRLNNGRLHIRKAKATVSSLPSNKSDNLFFKLIKADTLLLSNNNLYMETNCGDTILFFRDLDAELMKIQLDSLFFKNPEQQFNYQSFQFSTHAFVSNTLLPGLHLQSGKILYNSKWNKFVSDEFLVRDSIDKIHFHAGRIKLKLSLKKLLQNKYQTFDIFMIRPFARLTINPDKNTRPMDSSWVLRKLQPREIKISGGTFVTIFNNETDTLTLANTSVLARNLTYNPVSHQLIFDTLNFLVRSFTYTKPDSYTFHAGLTHYNGSNLWVNNSNFISNKAPFEEATLKQLRLQSFNLQELVSDNILIADSLILVNPETQWVITKNDTAKNDTLFSLANFIADVEQKSLFKTNIKHFTIKKGNIKVSLVNSIVNASFGTDYDLTWNQLTTGHTNDKPLSAIHGVHLTLTDAFFTTDRFRADIGHLTLMSNNGFVGFNNISISNPPNHQDSAIKINTLHIKQVAVRNLDYHRLLANDRLAFDQLLLNGLTADIEQKLARTTNTKSLTPKPITFNFSKLIPFETMFDTLEANNIRLRYKVIEKDDTATYYVTNFNMSLIPLAKQYNRNVTELPLFSGSTLHFDTIRISNQIKGFSVYANDGTLSSYDNTFRLKGLTLTSGKKHEHQSELKTGSILMTGLAASDSLPLIFKVRDLLIPKTNLKIVNFQPLSQTPTKNKYSKFSGLYQFSKLINQFTIDTVLFSSIDAVYYSGDSLTKKWSTGHVRIKINGVALTPSLALDTLPLQFNNLSANIYNRKFITGDSLYEVSAQHFSYNHLNQSLIIDSFYIKPLFDTLTFFNKNRWQTDRVNLFIPRILFSGIQLNDWNKTNRLHFSKIIAQGLHADLYRDKAYPRDSLIRPLLIGSLQKISQPFVVDTLLVNNGYFRYSEKEAISDKPGYLFFSDINLTGINLTNLSDTQGSKLTKIFTNGRLMGSGMIYTNFYFPLSKSQSSQFWFSGKSEKIDLTTLNTITQTNSGLTILSGKGTIDIPLITANDTVAIGSMMFKYRRLKVGLYNRKKANHNGGITAPLVSFVLNGLVLRSNNPNWFKRPRVGIAYFERNRNKSIANYIWKTTLSGVLSTLGFNNKEQRKRRKEYRKEEFEVQHEAVKNEKYGK